MYLRPQDSADSRAPGERNFTLLVWLLRNFARITAAFAVTGVWGIMVDEMGIVARIQARYGELRKSEKRVADYLTAHSSDRLEMSITELANTLGISEATVSRFTRALGYRGYSEMKLALASESSAGRAFINIPTTMHETDSLIEISQKLYGALSSSIGESQKCLDFEVVQSAVADVLKARHVLFLGVGGAASVCEEATHLLLKSGIQAVTHRDGYTQLVATTTVDSSFTVFGISHTGTTDTVARSLTLARERGARTYAITSDADSSVATAAEHSLVTWHHGPPQVPLYGDFLEGRICQMYIIYLIYLGVLFQSGGSAKRCLNDTAENLKQHYMRS